MVSKRLGQTLLLGAGLLVGIFALTHALQDEAFAIPECSVVCICNPAPCGMIPNRVCGDNQNCHGQAASVSGCVNYCVQQ